MVLLAEIMVASRKLVLIACKSFSSAISIPCEVSIRDMRDGPHVKVKIPYSVFMGKDSNGNNCYYDELHKVCFAVSKDELIEDSIKIVHPSFNLIDDALAQSIEEKFNENR